MRLVVSQEWFMFALMMIVIATIIMMGLFGGCGKYFGVF